MSCQPDSASLLRRVLTIYAKGLVGMTVSGLVVFATFSLYILLQRH